MAGDDQDDLEMILEYDEEESDSSTSESNSEDDGEVGEVDERNDEDGAVANIAAAAAGLIAPFQHEPLPRERNEGEVENVGDAREIDPTRLTRMDWCQCNQCQILPSFEAGDCLCCREIPVVVAEADLHMVNCITEADSFEPAILDPISLYIGWLHFTEKWRQRARAFANRNNEKYRYVAYRQFVRWCWGFLGKDVRVQLPACVQAKIKNAYPDAEGRYRGTILRPLNI